MSDLSIVPFSLIYDLTSPVFSVIHIGLVVGTFGQDKYKEER